MSKKKLIMVFLVVIVIVVVVVGFIVIKPRHVTTGEVSTNPTGPEDNTVVLTENSHENYMNYVHESISKNYEISEFVLNNQGQIILSIKDTLDDKDIAYIKASMDGLDDLYWGYKEGEEKVEVMLSYNDSTEAFFIQKNIEEN
ncbi:hypothetical protein [Fusibacter sp. 3D3]|uniref:hypothetical protein n=1 Tax=Fusibacter sp. 3D3 TaxID=1048380 RepID=UPI000852F982|nr:hypothetical protein [Fusibacter sp. 3D3]GAU79675.1 hypothetical protein F3D3_4339 [Fusibacter sp. 3D3]